MDLDLSDKLQARAPPAAEAPAAAGQKATWQGREAQMRQTQTKAAALRAPAQNYPRMPPRRNEPTRWQRTQKFAKRVRCVVMRCNEFRFDSEPAAACCQCFNLPLVTCTGIRCATPPKPPGQQPGPRDLQSHNIDSPTLTWMRYLVAASLTCDGFAPHHRGARAAEKATVVECTFGPFDDCGSFTFRSVHHSRYHGGAFSSVQTVDLGSVHLCRAL